MLPLSAAERRDVGLTHGRARIAAFMVQGSSAQSPTVMLIGGLNGEDESTRAVNQEIKTLEAGKPGLRLIAIPLANPERSKLQFPPTGVAYRENSESHALWRWIAI